MSKYIPLELVLASYLIEFQKSFNLKGEPGLTPMKNLLLQFPSLTLTFFVIALAIFMVIMFVSRAE